MGRAALMTLCVVGLLAGMAFAHPGHEYEPIVAEQGEVVAYVTPQTLVVKAQRPVPMLIDLYENGTFTRIEATSLQVTARSGEQAVPFEVSGTGTGYLANGTFPSDGVWSVELVLGEPEARLLLSLPVYPDSRYHVESEDAQYGLYYVGHESRLAFKVVEDATGDTVTPADATARVDRIDANGTLTGRVEVPLASGDGGEVLMLRHEFNATGLHTIHIRSEELGLEHGDLPPFEVNVAPARAAAADDSEEVPAPSALLTGVAIVAAALAASRRR